MSKISTLLTKFMRQLQKEGLKSATWTTLQLTRNQIQKKVKALQSFITYLKIRSIPYKPKEFSFVDQVNIISLGDVTPRIKWLNKFLSFNLPKMHKYYTKLYKTEVKRYFHQPIGVKGFEITYEGIKYQIPHHPKLIDKEKMVLELVSCCNINSVLDLACADGYYAILLERQGHKVTAVEGADYMFENAYIVRKCLDAKFRLIQADIESERLWTYLSREHFDMTILLDMIEHCDNPVKFLRKIRNVSKYLLIVVPDEGKFRKRKFRRTDIDHIYQFNLAGLAHVLSLSGFKIKQMRKRVGKLFVLAA